MALSTAEAMTQLAKLRDPSKRDQIAVGLTDLCIAQPLTPSATPIADDLLITLIGGVGTESKIVMAQKLSVCKWAPLGAIRKLAFEEIEVAKIIIKDSKRLSDKDMIDIANTGTLDHRRLLATRANLQIKVTDTLAGPAEPVILRALANNKTAEISENTLDICLTVAKNQPKLREALARRHDLSTDYATQLCIMLPENWREDLYRRFALDKTKVESLTVKAALGATSESADKEAEEVVDATEKNGKLSGEFALKALKTNQEILFDHALARVCKVSVSQWRVALAIAGVRAAAMACQAAGLDKTAYPIIHRALQESGRIHQSLEGDAMAAAANVFRMYGAEKAAKVLRQMGSKV